MFSKLSILGLVLSVAPFVSAVQIQVPENARSTGEVTIKWTVEDGDPGTWSLELIHEEFRRAYAIANNVDPSLGQITLTLPIVPPGPGYSLEAVNIGNINEVYGSSAQFTIEEALSTSAAPTPSSAPSATVPSSPEPTIKPPSQSTSQFGTIVRPSNQGPSATGANPSGSGSGSAGGPEPSTINGGLKSVASYFVVAASALLGAIAVGA